MARVLSVLCARDSALSRAQVREIIAELPELFSHNRFSFLFIKSLGDKDKTRSLRTLDKSSDFFTRELDQLLLEKKADLALHSAKDLPQPLHPELKIAYLSQGLDPRDALILRPGYSLESLSQGARIGTSSSRRDALVLALRSDLCCVDIRGTIEERLALLEKKVVDGVVIAEAALMRLKLNLLPRIYLPGETLPLQGKLALVTRQEEVFV